MMNMMPDNGPRANNRSAPTAFALVSWSITINIVGAKQTSTIKVRNHLSIKARNLFRLALLTIATTATCAPEPITAELTSTTHLKKQADLYLQRRELDRDFASGSVPFCASKLTVVD